MFNSTRSTALTDQTPMFIDPSRQRDLFANVRTGRLCELDLRQVGFDGEDSAATGCRTDIDEKEFAFCQFLDLYRGVRSSYLRWRKRVGLWTNFGLLFVLCLHTEQTSEQKEIDFQLC